MKVTSLLDRQRNETALDTAVRLRSDEIRLRIQPSVYLPNTGNYLSWREVSWTVIVDSRDEAEKFRQTLAAFFVRLHQMGLEFVRYELEAKIQGLPSEVPVEELLPKTESLTDSQELG